MSRLTLFATDGERNALIVGDQMLMGVDKVSIMCDVDRGVEMSVNFANFIEPMIPADKDTIKSICKALWNELSDE